MEFQADEIRTIGGGQLREASPSAEIWTGSQNTSQAGWVDQAGADVKRNLLIEAAFYGVQECLAGAIRNGTAGQFPCSGNPFASLAIVDDGRTHQSLVGTGSSMDAIGASMGQWFRFKQSRLLGCGPCFQC
jgi:hypothetical protein